jgi:outer membrane protein
MPGQEGRPHRGRNSQVHVLTTSENNPFPASRTFSPLFYICPYFKINPVNRSVLVNIILGIAVVVLYILHFTSKTQVAGGNDVKPSNDSLVKSINTTQVQKESKIVYLNIDTLFNKYEYYKKVSDEASAMIKGYQTNYETRVNSFQQKYQEYVDKAGAGLIPKEQAMKIEEDLQKEKTQIEQMETNSESIQQNAAKKLEVVQKKLYDFFKAFTKANNYSCILTYTSKGEGALGIDDSLDVTEMIIKGLNEEYHKMLESQPSPKK